ncbi:erythromycin esterase family protein [Streptomyces clavuligerus]|uniref:Erythromycin esterase n=1 Tax=Streptomyces clavuligerus TaxID=1901 RepID=D5SJZ0_STRCL|nr:erythromycin esterase family protein [Streptomyces clavuligerus]ANW22175.1 erythromycin esterase [Streptomyces clavuligerus]AXU17066.1 erythromycin esterase family protein [Streptomyces clavuligerus]EFG04233.1 Erythromycin esterase [Streptomyces clavuligerus]MBY6307290.1 erythromycin esterase family protein [Streptomyces clavuligerus]QCS10137.1 erythromycin esterase [Streptomyces clavuligerus]
MVTDVTDIKDTAHAFGAAAVRRLLPARPRVLALGEPTHGEDTLLELRNALFRQLVEEDGYRTIAIESDCLMGLVVDEYVVSGRGSLDAVMERGFSHGFGASAANRELVRWMRAHNEGRPVSERVRFAGCDGPLEITGAASPRQALTALHRRVAERVDAELLPCTADRLDRLLGADAAWTEAAAMMDPARSVGRSPEARELRLLADDLVALLDEQPPYPGTADARGVQGTWDVQDSWEAREAWDRTRLYARTAVGLLRYHSSMADPSPGRMRRLMGLRARTLADNLLALAERGPVLAFAHHLHLQRGPSRMQLGGLPLEWWSTGALMDARLGTEYGFLATVLGTLRHRGVDVPSPDTLEGLLYTLPEDGLPEGAFFGGRCVVDAPALADALGDTSLTPRVSPYHGYIPLDPARLARHDGLVFIKDVPKNPQPEGGEGDLV